jgi:hypothetical protein
MDVRWMGLVVVSLLSAAGVPGFFYPRALAQEPGPSAELIDEHLVKAVYLYSLSKFILWPNEHTWRDTSPLDICVYGVSPFSTQLETLGTLAARNHPIVVRAIEPGHSAIGCHILFVRADNAVPLELTSGELTAAGVLTVGESEEFLRQGGLVSLLAETDGVRIALNYNDARRAGFVIDGGLLDVARKLE